MPRVITRRNTLAGLGAVALAAPHIARAETRTVRLGYGVSVIDPSTAPWLSAAKTGGFWQAAGLDVQVTGFNGAGPALQLLANNQLDVVFTGTPDAMKLRDIGVPIRTIANAYDRNHNYPAVAADSPIKSIEEFRGKRMGLQTMTGSIYLWEKVLLQTHKMALTDLASVIPVGTGAPAVYALQSGQIDILGEWHGHYAFLETVLGLKLRKFDQDPALSEYSFVQAFFTRDETIQKDPQMLAGVLRGVAQGLRYAIENPQAAVRGHFEQFPNSRPTGIAVDIAVEQSAKVVGINVQLSRQSTLARRWGMASPQQIERVRDALVENGIIQKTLPWQDYYTPQFIDALNDYDVDAVVRKAKAAG
jgi:NitT/TauT family transport system substrate-binding protein